MIDPYVFRAYDIRGIYKKDIDEDLIFKIGCVLGKKKKLFIVGCDIRKSGASLSKALIKGLSVSGAKIIYIGSASFGQALYAGLYYKSYQTLFITASHLPSQYNGLKMYYGNGLPFSEKEIIELRDKVIKLKLAVNINSFRNPKVEKISVKKIYLEYFLEKFAHLKNNNLKIVVDCGNGAMCLSACDVFKRLGFEVIELNCKVNQNRLDEKGEPSKKNTKQLQQKVKKEKADFGVAFDGDGDRAVIIDNKGRYLTGNEIGIIFAKNILEKSKSKKIIITMSCSMAFEQELEPLKAKIIRVPIGHIFIIRGCDKHKAILGVEVSNHIVLPEYFLFDDALLTPLKIAEIISEKVEKLANFVDDIKIYEFEEIKFSCADDKKFEVIKNLKKELKAERMEFPKKYKNIDYTDGIKINFDNAWVSIRASNTSPIIRLTIEAKDKKTFKKIQQQFTKIIKDKIKNFRSKINF